MKPTSTDIRCTFFDSDNTPSKPIYRPLKANTELAQQRQHDRAKQKREHVMINLPPPPPPFAVRLGVKGQGAEAAALFSRLQIDDDEVDRLFAAFCEIDTDRSNEIDIHEFTKHFGIDGRGGSATVKKLFTMIDADGSGEIDFAEFVVGLWHFCTLSSDALPDLLFNLHARQDGVSTGRLAFGEARTLVLALAAEEEDAAARRARARRRKASGGGGGGGGGSPDTTSSGSGGESPELCERRRRRENMLRLLRHACAHGGATLGKFRAFAERHAPLVLRPLCRLQQRLRSRVLGVAWWRAVTKRRDRLLWKESQKQYHQSVDAMNEALSAHAQRHARAAHARRREVFAQYLAAREGLSTMHDDAADAVVVVSGPAATGPLQPLRPHPSPLVAPPGRATQRKRRPLPPSYPPPPPRSQPSQPPPPSHDEPKEKRRLFWEEAGPRPVDKAVDRSVAAILAHSEFEAPSPGRFPKFLPQAMQQKSPFVARSVVGGTRAARDASAAAVAAIETGASGSDLGTHAPVACGRCGAQNGAAARACAACAGPLRLGEADAAAALARRKDLEERVVFEHADDEAAAARRMVEAVRAVQRHKGAFLGGGKKGDEWTVEAATTRRKWWHDGAAGNVAYARKKKKKHRKGPSRSSRSSRKQKAGSGRTRHTLDGLPAPRRLPKLAQTARRHTLGARATTRSMSSTMRNVPGLEAERMSSHLDALLARRRKRREARRASACGGN